VLLQKQQLLLPLQQQVLVLGLLGVLLLLPADRWFLGCSGLLVKCCERLEGVAQSVGWWKASSSRRMAAMLAKTTMLVLAKVCRDREQP
jgi:hypothetical protein